MLSDVYDRSSGTTMPGGQKIFVTGGLGFIGNQAQKTCKQCRSATPVSMRRFAGSHTILDLLKNGYTVTTIDNLDNAYEVVYERLKMLAGDKGSQLKFIKVLLQSPCFQSCTQASVQRQLCIHRRTCVILMSWTPYSPRTSISIFDFLCKISRWGQ